VLLIEKHEMGGDCLNTGCVPSKALIRTAKLVKQIQNPQTYGISAASATVNFSDVMARVHQVIKDIEPHDSVERYTSLGVECAMGNAELLNPWEIKVTAHDGSSRVVSAKNIVLATGARPFVPTLPGLLESDYYTSDTVWSANELPRRLVVLGGGPIGCELAQCFVRLGSQVIQVDMAPRIMPREDEEVSNFVMSRFREEGIEILTAHQAVRVEGDAGERRLVLNSPAGEVAVAFDKLLIAIGRVARTLRSTNSLKQSCPIFTCVATPPVPTNSPILPPTKPGMPASMPCSRVCAGLPLICAWYLQPRMWTLRWHALA